MSITEIIIADSPSLISLAVNDPIGFENISSEQLNSMFDNTDFKDCINRIEPLYTGNYLKYVKIKNNMKFFIQLIHDLDYLNLSKEIELMIILHFNPEKDYILSKLNECAIQKYRSIIFDKSFIKTCISLNLIDLLIFKSKTKKISHDDFSFACRHGSLLMVKFIIRLPCSDIHRFNEEVFRNTCGSGSLEKAQYIWEWSLHSSSGKINLHVKHHESDYSELILKEACRSGNIELLDWLWKLSLQPGIGKFSGILGYSRCYGSSCNELVKEWLAIKDRENF